MNRGTIYITSIALTLILLFNACSVQKRHYRPGFHFEAAQKKNPKEEGKESKITVKENATTANADIIVSNDVASAENTTATTNTEITQVTVPVETPKATTHTTKAPHTKVIEKGSKKISVDPYDRKAYQASPKGIFSSLGDDKLIAIILCVVLGWLGIHRFFLGYPISAIIMIALFIMATVSIFVVFPVLSWIAYVALIVLIIYDLICLITGRELIMQF